MPVKYSVTEGLVVLLALK